MRVKLRIVDSCCSEPGICNLARFEISKSKHTSLSTVPRPGTTSKQALLLAGVMVVCSSLGRKLSFPDTLMLETLQVATKPDFAELE